MWCVFHKCKVYGEDNLFEIKTKQKAQEYYDEMLKSGDYLMGYETLYLFEVLDKQERELLTTEKYYYDIDETEYKYIPTKKLKFLVLQDFDAGCEIAKKGDIGFLIWCDKEELKINGHFKMIIEYKVFNMACWEWILDENGERDKKVDNDQLVRLLTPEEDELIRKSIENGRTGKFYEVLQK